MNNSTSKAGLAVMDAHITALNRRDAKAIAATLHFPHHRLSGTNWKTWDSADDYFNDFLLRAGPTWHHSEFTDLKVTAVSANKVHIETQIRRYDSTDSLITNFSSLWVIVEIKGVWAAKFRSSFAQK